MSERERFPILVHLLLESGDSLLLLRRSGTGRFDGCWAPPGGHLEAGETPRAAVLRETSEEVGLELDEDQLRAVGLMYYAADGGGFNLLFAARLRERVAPRFDPSIADAARWWSRTTLPDARVPWLDAALEQSGLDGAMDHPDQQEHPRPAADWYHEGH